MTSSIADYAESVREICSGYVVKEADPNESYVDNDADERIKQELITLVEDVINAINPVIALRNMKEFTVDSIIDALSKTTATEKAKEMQEREEPETKVQRLKREAGYPKCPLCNNTVNTEGDNWVEHDCVMHKECPHPETPEDFAQETKGSGGEE